MATYRAAILGCGGRSHFHVRAYDLLPDAEVVACCDHNGAQREEFAAHWGLHAYHELAGMIEAEEPDILHIVTRPATRVDQLTVVSEMGVPACIVEKPIAIGVRDWRALRDLAATTKTKIGVGAQFRYHRDLTRCREAVLSGSMGKPLFVEATAGLNICDQGVHVLDWAMSLLGDAPVTRVFGAASGAGQFETKHPSPENTTATLAFANGVHGLWTLGSEAPRVASGFSEGEQYTHCRVAAYCERGRVLFEEFGQWQIVSPAGEQGGSVASWDDWTAGNDDAQANLTKGMIDWLEGGEPVGTNLSRALEQWNAILGLYASAVERRPVAIPFDPPDDLLEQLIACLAARPN